ncbi:unnamed protein product, partial [Phaeothamnion confervicola]
LPGCDRRSLQVPPLHRRRRRCGAGAFTAPPSRVWPPIDGLHLRWQGLPAYRARSDPPPQSGARAGHDRLAGASATTIIPPPLTFRVLKPQPSRCPLPFKALFALWRSAG